MKRVKISAVLIVVIMLVSAGSLLVLKHYNDELRGRIERIQALYESGDVQTALELSNELNVYWHRYERAVTLIVHDDELEELNLAIAKITPFIANQNGELIAEIQSAYHCIDQIYEEEFPMWYNIL